MAGAVIGSAEFQLTANQQPLISGLAQAEANARQQSARIQGAIDGNLHKIEESSKRGGESLLGLVRAGTALTIVPAALAAVSTGFTKVVEQSQKAAQAQFALNKVYGDGAAHFKAFAAAQAQATGRSATDFEQAAVRAATLAKNYGLTAQQIEVLIQRSADLAAVHGKEIPDAAERVIAAIRGEAEAAEALGLTLNSDAVKAFAAMTDEQRKNFESLDQVTKAQIIYNELLRQTNDVQGAAVERANSQLGAFDKLQDATDKLAASVGQALVPGLAEVAGGLAIVAARTADVIEQVTRLQRLGERDGLRRLIALLDLARPGGGQAFIQQIIAGALAPPPEQAPGQGPLFGPTPDEVRAATIRHDAEQRRRAKEALDQRKDDVERRADIEIAGLEKEKQAQERAFADRRARLQQRRDAEITAAKDARDAAITALEQQAQAAADSYARQIRAAEAARDKEKQAAEDTRDAALRALEEVQRAAQDANEADIRQAEIARDRAKQGAEDARDAALRALDDEKRARQEARIHEDRARADETERIERELDKRHRAALAALEAEAEAANDARDAALRAIERQAEAAERAHARRVRQIERRAQAEQDAADAAIRALEEQARAEEERHRAAMDNLAAEERARLSVLDAQLAALDAAEKAEQRAQRTASLQEKAAKAQADLSAIQERQAAVQREIEQARRELAQIDASGIRTPGVRERARQRLDNALGAVIDRQAIEDASRKLAEAQAALRSEGVEQTRDAERERLAAQKDAIKAELDARRDAERQKAEARQRELDDEKRAAQERAANRQRELDDEKRAADEAFRKRKESLDARKRAVDDATRAEVEAIERRRDAEDEAHRLAVQAARDTAEQAKRAVEDRRRAEDDADADRRRQIADTYDLEQRQIKATYDDEETGVIPALRRAREAAEREFQAKRQAINDAYDAEQRRLKEVYDGPDGVIQHLLDQAEETRRQYQARTDAVNAAYNAERARIAEVYDDPVSGLFAQLERSKQATLDALNDQVEKWRTWKRDVTNEIQDALNKLDEFLKKVRALQEIGSRTPDNSRLVPGGIGPPMPPGFEPGGDLAYGPVVRNASPDSYWTSDGTHGGHPAADIFAPRGSPIYAPVGGTLQPGSGALGGNYAILVGDDGRAYYFAHGNVPFASGRVERGQQIGEVGNTGNARNTASHLHFAIASRPDLFGDLNGSGDIWGDASYWGSGGRVNPGGRDDEIVIDLLGQRIRVRGREFDDVGPRGTADPRLAELLPEARAAARKYDLPAAIIAAIPINEGLSSQLQTRYNNLFCYDTETEVATLDGWKPWADVTLDDVLATMNPRTGAIEYQRPSQIVHLPYVGSMLRVRSEGVDLLVTPEHRMWVRLAPGEPFRFMTARAISTQPVEYLTLSDMTPALASGDLPDGSDADAVASRDAAVRDARLEQLVDLANGHFSQFGIAAHRASDTAPLRAHIGHVVRLRALTEMIWSHAGRVVAAVQDLLIPSQRHAVRDLVRDAMSNRIAPALSESDDAVAELAAARRCPRPARPEIGYESADGWSRLIDLRPESSFQRLEGRTPAGSTARARLPLLDLECVGEEVGPAGVADARDGTLVGHRILRRFGVMPRPSDPRCGALRRKNYTASGTWTAYDGMVHCATVPNGLLIVRRNGKVVVSGNSIKGSGPAGSVTLPTEEVVNGQRVVVDAPFRVYHSRAESFDDFGRLVTQSGIYDDAVSVWRSTRDPRAFMRALGRRYATDPNFPEQVLRIAGYRHGGIIAEPTLLYGLRTGRLATMSETAPERILSPEETRAYRGGAPGGDTWNITGIGMAEVAAEIERRQRRRDWLKGA